MVHRGVSVATREHPPQPVENSAAAETQAQRPGIFDGQVTCPAFATRAQAQLLDALGWQIAVSPRREVERHAPLQCCFILRDGRRDEAVFGYTNQTAPLDMNAPVLRDAQSRVERFLSLLGEDRGILLQNMPLFAFGERRPDQIVVFGGWRFHSGIWKPFFLGPDGLGGVAAQDTLFARGTAPHHMAEICGHSAKAVMPWIAGVVRAIETLGGREAEADQAVVPGLDFDGLQVMSSTSGWHKARTCRPPEVTNVHQSYSKTPLFRHTGAAAATASWDSGADVFRFHQFGMNRRT
jgi:hypothetical protein